MVETNRRRIIRRLKLEGWVLIRQSGHDIFEHPDVEGIIVVPRHNQLTTGTAYSIAKQAGWQ